jgi:hypothetical protein
MNLRLAAITVLEGDTAGGPYGSGTLASRSVVTGGGAYSMSSKGLSPGDGGVIGAVPSLTNAVADALAGPGVNVNSNAAGAEPRPRPHREHPALGVAAVVAALGRVTTDGRRA